MTRTQKMFTTVLMVVAITFAMAFAVAISAPQGVAYADPLPSLQNVAVDGDGVLRWDAFSGAAEYNVLFGSGGGYARDGEGNSVTYYDLETIAKQFHWESGTYNWSVWAVDEGGNDLTVTASGTYTFTNTQTPLDAPTNLYWEHTVLRWDKVEGAGFYYVSVYKNGAFINGMSGDAYDNYKDFGTSFEVDKTYRCEVEARASYNDLEHKTSVATVSPDKTFSSVVPSLTNVTITDGQLTFDAVAGAYRYDIGVYTGGGIKYALPIDLYDICAGFGLEDGTYDVRINVYNEDKEPLVPEYTYNGFEWDDAYGPQPMTGSVTISGAAKIGETLTVNTSALGYTGDLTYTWWMENGFGVWIPYEMDLTVNTYVIPTNDLAGRRLYVRVESSGNTGYIESDPTDYIVKADAPAAPVVGKTDCTTNANNDGTITGVDDTMEYKLSSADDWTDCSGTSVTGLINGTYYVRIKETTTRYASAQATVTVGAYVDSTQYDITVVHGTSNVAKTSQGVSVTITADAPAAGMVFDAWTSTDGVVFADEHNATTTFEMLAKNVTVTATYKGAPLSGSVIISGDKKFGATLTATPDTNNTGDLSYQWKRGGADIAGANSATYTLVADDIGATLSVVVTSSVQSGSVASAATSIIQKADGSAAPTGITATACTTNANNDGTITGVTAAMEYKLSSASEWTDGTGDVIGNLVAGTYNVRVKETATVKAGSVANVVVNAFDAAPQYSVTVNNGSADPISAEEGTTITLTADAAPAGQTFDRWTSDDVEVASATSANTTFVMPAKNVTVTATYKAIQHAVSFNANGGTGTKAAENVNHGGVFALPENPFTAPEGKEFDGWAYSANGAKIDGNSIQVNNDVTLYARWKDVATEPSQPTQPDEPSQPSQPTQPDTPASSTEPSISEDKGGLSGGAIAGIVVGCFFGLLIIACAVLFILHKKGIVHIAFIDKVMKK